MLEKIKDFYYVYKYTPNNLSGFKNLYRVYQYKGTVAGKVKGKNVAIFSNLKQAKIYARDKNIVVKKQTKGKE